MKVRTTQEMLDSSLRLVGWRIYQRVGLLQEERLYATGLCTWSPDKARAFLFSDAPRSARKGNDDGLKWARAHAKHLRAEHMRMQASAGQMGMKWKPLRLGIVAIRVRVWPKPARSTTVPRTTEAKNTGDSNG